jgi:hypothetical protein
MGCQNSSLNPNRMDAPHRIGGKYRNPSRLGGEWDAPPSIGTKCQNPSLRPNEMSELLTAPERNGMLIFASDGSVTTLTRPARNGRKSIAPQSIGVKGRNRSLRPDWMSELPTSPEWNGCSSSEGQGSGTPSPPREETGRPSEHRNEMSEPRAATQWDVRTPHCARIELDAHRRIGRRRRIPSPAREELGRSSGHWSELSVPPTAPQ